MITRGRPVMAEPSRLRTAARHIEDHHGEELTSCVRQSVCAAWHVADYMTRPDFECLAIEHHSSSAGDDDVNLLIFSMSVNAYRAAWGNLREIDESESAAMLRIEHARGLDSPGAPMRDDVDKRR